MTDTRTGQGGTVGCQVECVRGTVGQSDGSTRPAGPGRRTGVPNRDPLLHQPLQAASNRRPMATGYCGPRPCRNQPTIIERTSRRGRAPAVRTGILTHDRSPSEASLHPDTYIRGLAHLLREALQERGPNLLVLDGLERLQREQGHSACGFGQIEDPLLRGLLVRIAEGAGQTFALVTSRFPLTDLQSMHDRGYRTLDIEGLSPTASVELLRRHGVRGDDGALGRLVQAYGRTRALARSPGFADRSVPGRRSGTRARSTTVRRAVTRSPDPAPSRLRPRPPGTTRAFVASAARATVACAGKTPACCHASARRRQAPEARPDRRASSPLRRSVPY